MPAGAALRIVSDVDATNRCEVCDGNGFLKAAPIKPNTQLPGIGATVVSHANWAAAVHIPCWECGARP